MRRENAKVRSAHSVATNAAVVPALSRHP